MTVSALITRNDITATASQTVFIYTFRVIEATDMAVYQNGVLLSSGYTVTGVNNTTGGTVVLDTGASAGQIVSLVLAMPLDRTTNYQNSGKFLADDVNEDFDKIYIGAIQNENLNDRSLRLKDVEPPTSGVDMTIPLKADRKGKFLSFNATTGAPEVSAGTGADAYDSAAWSAYNFTGNGSTTAFVLGIVPHSENNTQVYIDGVYQQKDGYSLSGSTITFSVAPPNLSTIEVMVTASLAVGSTSSDLVSYLPAGTGAVATTVQAKLRESVSVKDFGAVGDGVADDTAAIQAAINSIGNSSLNGTVFIPSGIYKISSTINMNSLVRPPSIIGQSSSSVTIITDGNFGSGVNMMSIERGSANRLESRVFKGFTLRDNGGTAYGLSLSWVTTCLFEDIGFYGLSRGLTFLDTVFLCHFDRVSSIAPNANEALLSVGAEMNNILFSNCSFIGVTYGAKFNKGGTALKFSNCNFEVGSNSHLAFTPSTGQTIKGISVDNCYFENGATHSILIEPADANGVDGFDITSNYFIVQPSTVVAPLRLRNCTNGTITSNSANRYTGYFYNRDGTAKYLEITNNNYSVPAINNAGDADSSVTYNYIANNSTGQTISHGFGTPESVVTASKASIFYRIDGGAGTALYVKESGTGNTGWVAK